MKITKILAASAAAVMAAASLSAITSAATKFTRLEEGEAILGFGDADWKAAGWGKEEEDILDKSYFQTAKITGNGTYTVGIDLSAGYINENFIDEETGDPMELSTANGIGAMGINVNFDAEDETYNNFCINIKSVKFDGVESIKSGVTSYTNNEDGGKRCNVLNPWANYDSTKEDHIAVDPATASSVMTDFTGEWTTCVVEFEVTGLATDNAADDAADNATTSTDTTTDTTTSTDTTVKTDENKGSPDTGVEGIAVVAGVAALAAGAVIVSKKRK